MVIDDTVTSQSVLKTLPQSNQAGNLLKTSKGTDFVKDIIKRHSIKKTIKFNSMKFNT